MPGRYEDVGKLAPSSVDLADHIIECLSDKAFEEFDELAEDWPDVPDEAQQELSTALDDVVKAWMRKHLKCPGWEPIDDEKLVKGTGEPE